MRRAATGMMCATLAFCLAATAEVYDPNVLPRRGIDFYDPTYFYANYGHLDWEIKALYPHDNGYLGTFNVNDIINVSYVVGVVGDRASLSAKASGNDPLPKVWIYEGGAVREILDMVPGAD
jgi:hypothetical protein